MSNEIREYATKTLLSVGGTSWGAYEWFYEASRFCSMVLPITGVISFLMVFVINWPKFKKAVCNRFNKIMTYLKKIISKWKSK